MKRVIAVAVLAVGLLGCGGASRTVSPEASAALQVDVQKIRDAAVAGDLQSATLSLSDLRAKVATLHAQGELDDTAMARILTEAAAVEQNLALIPTTAAPPTAPPPTAAPPTPQPGNGHGHGNDKPKGKGDDHG